MSTNDPIPVMLDLLRLDGEEITTSALKDDEREVFAVHSSIGNHDRFLFTVTHISTGLAVTRTADTEADAWKIVDRLLELPWNWEDGDITYFRYMLRHSNRELRQWFNSIKQ